MDAKRVQSRNTVSRDAPATSRKKSFAKTSLGGRVRDKEGKRQALLQAGAKLFAAKGYDGTTTREIAACAGCAEGLIHKYFHGKAGLLPALIEERISKEVVDLNRHLSPAPKFEQEFLQLVEWEVDRMWEDRDFLKIVLPRALLDPQFGKVLNRVRGDTRAEAIAKRFLQFKKGCELSKRQLHSLADLIGILGLVCGFMRPVILGHRRDEAKKVAIDIAGMLLRSI